MKPMKEVWSNRYGKNPAEGLHKWLEKCVPSYKRQDLHKYINGFASYMGKPDKRDTVDRASMNFQKWTRFVLTIKVNHSK